MSERFVCLTVPQSMFERIKEKMGDTTVIVRAHDKPYVRIRTVSDETLLQSKGAELDKFVSNITDRCRRKSSRLKASV